MAATTQNAVATQPPGNNPAPPPMAQPQAKSKTILALLQEPAQRQRLAEVLPRHLSPERMMRVVALAISKTPKLAECTPLSLLGAVMVCASLGLEPNTPLGHVYLIPFNRRVKDDATNKWTAITEVQVIIGYKGFIDLARRSGTLVSIHADVVYKGDEFSFEYGSKMHLSHRPVGAREGRQPLFAYAHAKLTDGEAFEVLPYDEVLKVRDGSQGYRTALQYRDESDRNRAAFEASPWVAHEHEMAAKTMVRRLSKWLSLSIEFANAAALDALSETGRVNTAAFAENSNALFDPSLAERPLAIEHSSEEGMGMPGSTSAAAGREESKVATSPPATAAAAPLGNTASPPATAQSAPSSAAPPADMFS